MRTEVRKDAVPQTVQRLCARLREGGHGAWVVGGGLRDLLRGEAPKDWDIATSATPEQVTRLFRKVIPTGVQHGTVTVLLGGGQYEVTTLRGRGPTRTDAGLTRCILSTTWTKTWPGAISL